LNQDLEDLLAEFVERRERGEPLTAERFAAAHPEHEHELRPALEALERTAALLPSGDIPQGLGPYAIEARLGSGGMGEVFAGRNEAGQAVAIKCLLPRLQLQPRAIERLRREGSVLQSIDDPGIVRIEAIEEHSGSVFLVMEKIDGGSLSDRLKHARQRHEDGERSGAADLLGLAGGGSGEQRAVQLIADVARSLDVAHSRGLLHRDLKPGNVLLRSDGSPVLVDFGLVMDPDADTLTSTGDVLGTPQYMAPEQAYGREATIQSDVYGLAAILYELVTLTPPHHGTDPLQVLHAVRHVPVRPAQDAEPSVSPELARVLRRALAHHPGDRWRSAEEFAAALEAVLDGRPASHLTISLHQRISEFWQHNRRATTTLAGAIVLLALGAALWQSQAASQRAQQGAAIVAACTTWLDDTRDGGAAAAQQLDAVGAEPALARWFADGATSGEPTLTALDRGVKAWRKRKFEEAITEFRRVVKRRPDLPLGIAMLGIAASYADQSELAERELVAASRTLPQCVKVWHRLAHTRAARRNWADAATAWRKMLALQEDNAPIWRQLASAELWSGHPEAGLVAIDKALALTDGEPDPNWLHLKAICLEQLERYEEAIPLMREAVRRAPSINKWKSLAMFYDKVKPHRLREARDAYEQSIALDPVSTSTSTVHCLRQLVHLYSGSDRHKCKDCKVYFEQHPDLFDPVRAEDFALQMLDITSRPWGMDQRPDGLPEFANAPGSDSDQPGYVEACAEDLVRAGQWQRFAARIDELLEQDFDSDALGRLLKAKKKLGKPK